MIVTSDYTISDTSQGFSRWKTSLSYIVTIIAYGLILSMSYEIITPNIYLLVVVLVISLVVGTMSYLSMSKEFLEKLSTNPFSVTLQQHPFLGPIVILLTFIMLGTLITFNMFA